MTRPRTTSSPTFEEVASRLAAAQHGVVTRQQLLAAGISPEVIGNRVRGKRLHVLHAGVYRMGPLAPPHSTEMAACLACGAKAVLSHRSAGALWQLIEAARPGEPVEVTITGGFRRRPVIRVHRIGTLRPDEVTRHKGIPVTTPARTLYDLASRLRPRPLERAVAEAIALRLVTAEAVLAMAERRRGRKGARELRAVLDGGAPPFVRSEAEDRFLALLRRARAPVPKVNVMVAGHEVDFYWPRHRLAVEIDGSAFHTSPRAYERDRRRDTDLAAAGIRVIRVTWQALTRRTEAVLLRLGQALATSGVPD